ncbi:MAG: ABC transporter ATP-binding protein [Dactylosporangium sp.]|nr:ABC transporter ATP-binding protein [Dactylosporangium sp.]NNJ60097.1 ABC transporter ATP-binding protein [Dactylosporangium sp.]
MLEVTDLRKTYGERPVLDGVQLTVGAGQIMGLLGANGAGKTTLISIIAGLRGADSGSVRVAGLDALRQPRRAARHIGLAPQELGLYPMLTVAQNLAFFARLAGLRGGGRRRRVAEIAAALDLADQLGRCAGELSGGQQRRLHTAMAVLHRTDVLFLDEPTVGADVRSRAGILDVVRAMAAEGTAIVYTTHNLMELEQLGADIAVLHAGRIAVEGHLDDVVNRYATASVGLRFDGAVPALPGWHADGSRLTPDLPVTDPAAAAARALAALDPNQAACLTGVDVTHPSLETAYLAITGQPRTSENHHALVA